MPRLLPVPSEAIVSPPLHERRPRSPDARSPRCRMGPSAMPPIDSADDRPPALLRPLASLAGRRSWTLELAARQADTHTQQGLELADRGACFSARSEFLRALELVAETLDSDRRTAEHGQALAAGLRALGEARNFPPHPSRSETDRTYCTHAEERLAASVGEELAGSMALYGLGKLHAAMARRCGETMPSAGAYAVTFYRASLLVCPRNYMVANDLGVLLAESGRSEEARAVLAHSLSIHPHPAGWKNLQALDRLLAHDGPARKTQPLPNLPPMSTAATPRAGVVPSIRWVHPEAFGRTSGALDGRPQPPRPLGPGDGSLPEAGGEPCPASRPVESLAGRGADEQVGDWSGLGGWEAARAVFWQAYVEGQFAGHAQIPHPPEDRLRAGDLLELVDRSGGPERRVRVSPDGMIALPAIGSTPAQGLTLAELQRELNERYGGHDRGAEVVPVLVERAPVSFLVLGEVRNPGRLERRLPTTLVEAIRLAGGWKSEANLRQIAVFRRDEGSRLVATMVNLSGPLVERRPEPWGEIPLADGDVVVVPGKDVLSTDELAERLFARRVFGALPLSSRAPLWRLGTL